MLTKDRVVNLVAVRLKSTRLPGKALLLLQGKPVLGHLMDRVSRSNIPEKTVICTSTHSQDDAICEFAMTNNSSFFRGHPENVLLRFIEAAEEHSASHIVRITGDNPLTDPFLIDEMIEKHLREQADYTYTEDTPRGTRPEIFSVVALKKCLELAEDPNYSEYMTLYFKDYPQVFKNVRYSCLSDKYRRPDYIVTIDTPEDFDVVKKIYDALYPINDGFTLLDVIDFLDNRSEIRHDDRKKKPIDLSSINTKLRIGS